MSGSGARAGSRLQCLQSGENYTTATDTASVWPRTIFYLNFLDVKLNVMTQGKSVNQVLS